MVIHIVQPGENVYSIARLYNVPPRSIIYNNGLTNPNRLLPGQALVILIPQTIHGVQQGETLESIANQYNTTVMALLQNNPFLEGRQTIYPGQMIVIEYDISRLDDALVVGYLYTSADEDTLRKNLPYMTYASIFPYMFTEEGELLPMDDEGIINIAREYFTAPAMVLTNIVGGDQFSTELISSLLNNLSAQDNLVENILETMLQKGHRTLDLDIEFIPPEDKLSYVEFVEKLVNRLNPYGFPVAVALAPKTSPDQPGLLYESHDYEALGRAANAVIIMAYEWGYKFGPPMAVAPIDQVRRVLDYAVTAIPPEKIFLGMPNYGYEWPLPYVRGETVARTVSNQEAIEIASGESADIFFDETAQTPYFYYTDDSGQRYVVWFEDARSYDAKARLLEEYRLRGFAIWTAMDYFQPLWTILNGLYDIIRIEGGE